MIDVFLERRFARPIESELVLSLTLAAQGCFDRHRVAWQGSLLARDGRRLLCHFRAPDLESARLGLRRAGADITTLWGGTLHDAPDLDPAALTAANVVVERRFAAPISVSAVQALEDAGAACLQHHRVRFLRTLCATDHRRMHCLYRAPDAESVRLAQHQAGMPVTRIWACRRIVPPAPTPAP
ncbi:nickel-binding protein [Halomonas salifodinae]|uniref:nickel-binding protein n=1 Tax=Halomonas salifodinae TaxID=438745 RepID=UPI0033B464B8